MPTTRHFLPLAAMALLAVACTSTGAPAASPSANPSGSPAGSPGASPSPATLALEHPTGKDDIILRYDEGGGFVMPSFLASRTPYFTLYGDGTVVFQQFKEEPPPTLANGAMPGYPLRIAKLSEEQVQELLTFALTEGGLAIARDKYDNQMIADAGTTFFTIDAGGVKKTVQVYALGLELDANEPDALARQAFNRLAERLRDFDQKGTIASDVYVPASYRGVLFEAGPVEGVVTMDWPWQDLKPADFVAPKDPEGGFPRHLLTPDDVSAMGVELEVAAGGLQNLFVTGTDGKVYSLAIRPLLPDEQS